MFGLVNLITLILVIVMGVVVIVCFDVLVWWKFIGKLIVILFVVICVILGVVVMF